MTVEDRRSANELRSLFEKELMFNDCERSVFGRRISVGREGFAIAIDIAGLGGCTLMVVATFSSEVRFGVSGEGGLDAADSDCELSEALLSEAEDNDSEKIFLEWVGC